MNKGLIDSVSQLVEKISSDLATWEHGEKPWFRGESSNSPALSPKIASYSHSEENYLLQSFRRQAGGLAEVPPRSDVDLWLFLAQHYHVPTRLLDWTEGALHALYFAINENGEDPRVYMLNPLRLNERAGLKVFDQNYPLSWANAGQLYVGLAWGNRELGFDPAELMKQTGIDLEVPIAVPATYQDNRMNAQRSCFTIHGTELRPLKDLL